ncbi:septum-promoting GTP-binding protein 1 [Solanum lycopersicum]|nr:septum-promoting GTP-binding protein 1-like [Solanum lycopersicum]
MMSHQFWQIKTIKVIPRKWKVVKKASIFKKKIKSIWEKIRVCSNEKFKKYKKLSTKNVSQELQVVNSETVNVISGDDSDLVSLKISILGDCQIGKTSFVAKYVGDEQEKKSLQMNGLNLMEKILVIEGARIAFTIWDVGGDHSSYEIIPIACKDAVAILFMFDLNCRSSLNSVKYWYIQARKWNKSAIPILIGTKFDDFVQLPLDIQWTIVSQARTYAKAMKATLFFSSATHNINVNKIFKFIMAKLFNLPWTVQRNLTIGEPIIDF